MFLNFSKLLPAYYVGWCNAANKNALDRFAFRCLHKFENVLGSVPKAGNILRISTFSESIQNFLNKFRLDDRRLVGRTDYIFFLNPIEKSMRYDFSSIFGNTHTSARFTMVLRSASLRLVHVQGNKPYSYLYERNRFLFSMPVGFLTWCPLPNLPIPAMDS